jgi:hypothetical protein
MVSEIPRYKPKIAANMYAYSEYWLASESPMAFMFVGLTLLIVGGGLDESFGTILWIRDIFSNRQKKG